MAPLSGSLLPCWPQPQPLYPLHPLPELIPSSFAQEYWRHPQPPFPLETRSLTSIQASCSLEVLKVLLKQAQHGELGSGASFNLHDSPACLVSAWPTETIGPTLQMLLSLSEKPKFVSQGEQALPPFAVHNQSPPGIEKTHPQTPSLRCHKHVTSKRDPLTCSHYLLENLG